MKKFSLAVAALAGVSAGIMFASQAQAQRAPHDAWCRDQSLGRGSVQICSAYTFQQCMASRTSHTESCYLNPRYDPRFSSRTRNQP